MNIVNPERPQHRINVGRKKIRLTCRVRRKVSAGGADHKSRPISRTKSEARILRDAPPSPCALLFVCAMDEANAARQFAESDCVISNRKATGPDKVVPSREIETTRHGLGRGI